MTFLSAFVLSFGTMLAAVAVVAGWLFRTTPASLWMKLVLPAAIVALACYAPLAVNALLGLPAVVGFGELPARAELIAFVAHDKEGLADLWLKEGDIPRAYETALDHQMKKVLAEAAARTARGERTMLTKRGTAERSALPAAEAPDETHSATQYRIDDKAFAPPNKEGG